MDITCQVQSRDTGTDITWYKDGDQIIGDGIKYSMDADMISDIGVFEWLLSATRQPVVVMQYVV